VRSPAKSGRIAVTEREKQADTAVMVGEVQNVRLAVFGDSVVMTPTTGCRTIRRPIALRVWAERGGRWPLAISLLTDIK